MGVDRPRLNYAESGERETQQGSSIRLVPMRTAAAPELASEQPG